MSKKKVLIVDDEKALQEVIAWMFDDQGYQTYTTGSGDDAFEFLKQNNVDFVLSDVRMPNGSGIDLIKQCRENNIDTPILLMSGFSETSREEAQNIGALDIFSKPLDFEKIFKVVEGNIR